MSYKVTYTVKVEFLNANVLKAFQDWLEGGHIKEVIDCGAESCQVVTFLDAEIPTLECRYIFPNEDIHQTYINDHGPRLQLEGITKFPEGIRITRQIGKIIFTA